VAEVIVDTNILLLVRSSLLCNFSFLTMSARTLKGRFPHRLSQTCWRSGAAPRDGFEFTQKTSVI
jgi:hypothetical protein